MDFFYANYNYVDNAENLTICYTGDIFLFLVQIHKERRNFLQTKLAADLLFFTIIFGLVHNFRKLSIDM